MDSLLLGGEEFLLGLAKSFFVILSSEIGDKTFFIAALMSMSQPRFQVFAGAIAALAAMTVLSTALGWAAPSLIPKVYTHYAAVGLFFFFGFKNLYDLLKGDKGEENELEEVEKELADINRGGLGSRSGTISPKGKGSESGQVLYINEDDTGKRKGLGKGAVLSRALTMFFSQVFLKAFSLTFLAEWGDRSQIATIGLAASEDPIGVTVGGVIGHAICTGAAVMGGRHLATHIDERTVQICGALLFIAFGAHALYTGP